jgi:hypothetical protein
MRRVVLASSIAMCACGSAYWLGGAAGEERGSAEAGVPDTGALPGDAAREAEAVVDAGVDADVCVPTAIVTGAKSPTSLAVDDDGVFWSETGHAGNAADPNVIVHAAKDGSGRANVVALSGLPGAIALDSGFVYYVEQATPPPAGYTIFREGKPGKAPSTRAYYAKIASPAPPPGDLAVASNVVWVDGTTARAMPIDAPSDTYATIASGLTGGRGLAVNGATAWIGQTTGTVLSVDPPALPVPVAGSAPSFGVAVDPTRTVWTTETAVKSFAGGSVTTIASCATACDAVATDGTNVIWVTTTEVWEATAGSSHAIGTGYTDVHHLAIDASRVYWTDTATGTIWSTCK